MFRYLFFIFCLFFNFGCDDSSTKKSDGNITQTENTKTITSKDIQSLKYDDYALSEDATKALENWPKYQELNQQIGYLRNGDFSFFNGEQSTLITFITDFSATVPESIKTAPILSRITALETMLLKLNSTIKLDNLDKQIQLKATKEFLVAMSNLNLQINKKFELDSNLIEKIDTIE